MEYLLNNIEKALDAGLYFIALQSTLTLPDICGALGSEDGKSSGERYKEWYNNYVLPNSNTIISAEDCYYFRCSYIHQGKTVKSNEKASYNRIAFVIPNEHCSFINNTFIDNNETVYNPDICVFCREIIRCVRAWLELKKTMQISKQTIVI